jgi:tetratricopeptide (TPR) repeat protein
LRRDAAELYAEALFGLGQAEEASRYADNEHIRNYLNPVHPPVRVLATVQNREYELEQLPRELRPNAGFVFRRNRVTLPLAQACFFHGREAAQANDPVKALEYYQKAAAVDRYDPDSRMGAGFIMLQLRRLDEAVKIYGEADALAPGWYRLSTEAWAARELAAGRLIPPAWLAILQLESGRSSPQETLQFAGPVLKLLPRLAPLHYWQGKALEALGKPAEESYRKALTHAGEPNLKTRALFALGALTRDRALLEEAADLKGHLPSAAQALWMLDEL